MFDSVFNYRLKRGRVSCVMRVFIGAIAFLLFATGAHAQRQMETLGRGVIAMRSGSSSVYIGWRLLSADPEDIGFNIYRSQNGGAAQKLNTLPITNTTDFVDTTATLSVSNSWFVRPVTNGVELPPSAPFGVAANATVPVDFQNKIGPYLRVPLQPVPGGNYYTHHVWPGDIDGDGEFDFVATRLPSVGGVSYVDAYLRDGTFLWRMNMGYNSTNSSSDFPPSGVSVGHSDNVTVYDLDGDGKAEVIVRTANGVTVANAVGTQVASITAGNDVTQYISVIDGSTGVEKARATLPNPVPSAGAMSSHMGIMFGDGVRPSLVCESINRNADGSFNLSVTCWNYRNGTLVLRWLWVPPNDGKNYARAHQIRIADVDHDGKDEFCEIGFVLHDDGDHATPLFSSELLHGDRYHIADLDPDRPGLETYAIQQDNPNLLATALHDSATGKMIKKWYSSGVVDVGRGNAGDVDLNTRGVELFSTQPGLWNCKGKLVNNSPPYPNFSIWWDADLAREQLDDAKIDKYGVGRILSPYNMQAPALDGLSTWRNAQPLYGDLFGDWREEVLFESSDFSSLIIFTPVSASTTRLVCLAQDPEYRECMTVKGYMQSTWPSFYIGAGMGVPPIQPISDAKLVWRGDGAANNWDELSANWFTNNLWISNDTAVAFTIGDTVLFDRTGSNAVAINLVGTLAPGAVKVHSSGDYTFTGGTLDGAMSLTKGGAGVLTLNNTNTYSGRTLISEGLLIVNGSMPASPVVVRSGAWLDGRIGGNGNVGAGVTIEQGGGVSPGQGTNSPGALTVSSLTLRGYTLNDFDLSDDPSGATNANDSLNVIGNLTLQGTNKLVIHMLDGVLQPGTYTLITYSGMLTGSLNNLIVDGIDGVPTALANPPGAIQLIVKSSRAPSSVVWAGGGGYWDLVTSSNWLNGGVSDWFVPLDSARLDNTGAASPILNLVGALPIAGVTVDATANYTLTGSGNLTGAGGLTKTNSGTLTVMTDNDYTGRTVVGGGVFEVDDLNVAGSPGRLGSTSVSPTNLVFYGSRFRISSGQAYTDRGLTLASGGTLIETPSSGALVNLAGQIVGAGSLVKVGPGTLILSAANSYSGTVVGAGTLQLGSATANTSGLGSGSVTLTNGGILSLFGAGAGDLGTGGAGGPFVNALNVPAGVSGSFQAPFRFSVNNTLTGAGTLNVGVTGVRGDFNGNWSAFTGTINVTSLSGTSDFRCNNSAGYPNAKINVGATATWQNRVGSTPTIPVGELAGAAGAAVSAPGGNGGTAVNWRVGGLNTTATYAGNTFNSVGFIKEGSGTWIWTGTNISHSGQTTINAGALQIGNGGTSGSLGPGNVTDNATLIFNRSNSINDTNSGIISGNGSVIKRGAGTLTFSKSHTFSGAMIVETGTLAFTNSGSAANASSIVITNGALLDVSSRSNGAMSIVAGQKLSGTGSVKGDIVLNNGATLSPGYSIGTLTFSNALTLSAGCTNYFELTKSPTTNDIVRVLGVLNNGGVLIVTNISANSLSAADSFKLFNATSYNGSFASVTLPALNSGLEWNTNALNASGVITVVPSVPATPPVISGVTLSGSDLVMNGTNGAANGTYFVLNSTNLATPLADWSRVATGQFNASGAFIITNAVSPNSPHGFYLLQLP